MRSSLAIYDALTSVSVPQRKAYRVAQALETDMTQFREGLATKDDISRLEADIRRLEAAMNANMARLEASVLRMIMIATGTVAALVTVLHFVA
ncbi:MAG TPA: hypothetical protein VFA48_02490 [Gammaproteobacteria bacterium]|nr:hypothetical protein [Gammaproteobacteria bacterium]